MTNMFLSFLEISIPISFIIAVLLLLTPFLNKWYAAKWKYWIWIVLALRLMIPLGGNSGLPVGDRQPQRETLTSAESEKTPLGALADGTARGRVIVEIPAQMTTPIMIQPEKAGSSISILDIIALVWMLGSLFFISVHLVSYFHYKRQIRKKGKMIIDNDVLRLLMKLKRELHIKCKVSVIEYPEAASPLLIGFCNHILVLPKVQYNSEELFFILKHELVHLKRGDIYLKLLFAVANAVHWFNPLVWIMQKEAAVDMELACDERVTQGADYAARKAYTETLLSTLHKQSAKKTVLSTGFYGGKKIMNKRFKNILAKKRKKNGVTVLICVIMLAVSLGTLVGCSITKENTEDDPGSLGTEDIQNENSKINQPSSESALDNSGHDSNENESVNVNEPDSDQKESSMQTTESINPETFPVGEYHDDMGSQLIISKVNDKNYTVDFGIYKSFYVEDAVGSYDVNSGVLSFSGIELGTDIIGSEIKLSADVTIQGDNLTVTLTYSEYPYWPVGSSFEFEPGQP